MIVRPGWWLPERLATPESLFESRRGFLRQLGMAGLGLVGARGTRGADPDSPNPPSGRRAAKYPAARNPVFDPGWRLTDEKIASRYNNFYEFTLGKDVYRHVERFETSPWAVEIGGLIEKPLVIDAAELAATMPLEERVYRFRCVEAWAMIVPWTGFPFARLAEKVRPKPEARFVRFLSASKVPQMPGIAENPEYPWPYFEGLRIEEALHPLTLVVTGVYGKPLAKQFGSPLRMIVPWKYGYKGAKSVVKIEFVAHQPRTFWEALQPQEYPFESNVNPQVPHPRWSQATERMIDTGDRMKTRKFNGYGDQVARLYTAGGAAASRPL